MRLSEAVDDVDGYVDSVAGQVEGPTDFALVGDSFGAGISLTFAIRQPAGLRGLVLSGGFGANPLPRWKGIATRASRYTGGPVYRQTTTIPRPVARLAVRPPAPPTPTSTARPSWSSSATSNFQRRLDGKTDDLPHGERAEVTDPVSAATGTVLASNRRFPGHAGLVSDAPQTSGVMN